MSTKLERGLRLLANLTCDHEDNTDDHSWRRCRLCLTASEITDTRKARSELSLVLADYRRMKQEGQTAARPWMCRTCLTHQPVEDGVICHFVCESCRAKFERLTAELVEAETRKRSIHDRCCVKAAHALDLPVACFSGVVESAVDTLIERWAAERETHAATKAELAADHTSASNVSAHPSHCPVTGRPFFMVIETEGGDSVATYGGPYDSYTIPEWNQDDREFRGERFDHDKGAWVEGGEPYSFKFIDSDATES